MIYLELGDIFTIYTLDELSEKYGSNLQNLDEHVSLFINNEFNYKIPKKWLGMKFFVFSMNYRDYDVPCFCDVKDMKDSRDFVGTRMSSRVNSGIETNFDWSHDEDGELQEFLIKEVNKNIFNNE